MKKSILSNLAIAISAVFCHAEHSLAAWNGCEKQVNVLLSGQRDQFVLKQNRELYDQFGLAKCDGDLAVNIMVAIHEGVHFLDLNLKFPILNDIKPKALFLMDMSRLPYPLLELPSPYEIFETHGANQLDIRKLKQSGVISEYKEYVLDREARASDDINSGFGTEFNAYCHGSLSSYSLLPFTKELEIAKANPQYAGPLITQRTGVIAFMGLTIAYFDVLKTKLPSEWDRVLADSSAMNFYNKLLTQGVEALRLTTHCESVSKYEKDYFESVMPLIKEDILKDFQVAVSFQEIRKLAICQ